MSKNVRAILKETVYFHRGVIGYDTVPRQMKQPSLSKVKKVKI